MENRRSSLLAIAGLASTAALAGCSGKGEEDVGAVEDLMREHGVLRRAILVFRESAGRLRRGGTVDPRMLVQTAKLFRSFGEDYHERKLEEAYIFPAIKKAGGPAAGYVDVLIDQHNKGRAVIDYIMDVAGKGTLGTAGQDTLARTLEQFELMYANHAAREDTILFPAWKKAIGAHGVEEMGDRFEDIEKAQFGGDGFDQAVKEIGDIEGDLGLSDIAQFTVQSPRQ
jgi:hemerythrin-like domain-containing protein